MDYAPENMYHQTAYPMGDMYPQTADPLGDMYPQTTYPMGDMSPQTAYPLGDMYPQNPYPQGISPRDEILQQAALLQRDVYLVPAGVLRAQSQAARSYKEFLLGLLVQQPELHWEILKTPAMLRGYLPPEQEQQQAPGQSNSAPAPAPTRKRKAATPPTAAEKPAKQPRRTSEGKKAEKEAEMAEGQARSSAASAQESPEEQPETSKQAGWECLDPQLDEDWPEFAPLFGLGPPLTAGPSEQSGMECETQPHDGETAADFDEANFDEADFDEGKFREMLEASLAEMAEIEEMAEK